jgi:hypothetical protein
MIWLIVGALVVLIAIIIVVAIIFIITKRCWNLRVDFRRYDQ